MPAEIGPCRRAELPRLNELANRVFRGRRPGDMASEYPLLFSEANLEQLRVAREGDRLVGHVGISLREVVLLGCRVITASIGAVCTDPEFRGQGIGSALMADATEHSRARGASLMLISGTRGLYRRVGYVQVGRFLRYTAGPGELPEYQTLAVARPEQFDEAIRLHQLEPVRFVRPREDWQRLLAAQMLMNRPGELLYVLEGGRPIAYLAVRRPEPGGEGAAAVPEVMEYAGARSAVAAGLRVVATRYAVPEAALLAPADDLALQVEAGSHGCASEYESFSGTLGIIDPPRFFADVQPYLAECLGSDLGGVRVEPAGEGAAFRLDADEFRLETMGALTALVFGGGAPEERGGPPESGAAVWQLLSRAFPMPLPWYGYNYV